MPKAIWNGAVLAESDRCEVVEGNQYFVRRHNAAQHRARRPHTFEAGTVLACSPRLGAFGDAW